MHSDHLMPSLSFPSVKLFLFISYFKFNRPSHNISNHFGWPKAQLSALCLRCFCSYVFEHLFQLTNQLQYFVLVSKLKVRAYQSIPVNPLILGFLKNVFNLFSCWIICALSLPFNILLPHYFYIFNCKGKFSNLIKSEYTSLLIQSNFPIFFFRWVALPKIYLFPCVIFYFHLFIAKLAFFWKL